MSGSLRTITAKLTDEQYSALYMAAEEAANDSGAREAMAVVADAWEASEAVAGVAMRADEEAEAEHTPRVRVSLTAEITGEWVTDEVVANTVRQLATTMALRLRRAVEVESMAWRPPVGATPDEAGR